MTKIKRCYKGKPLYSINLKSGDSYHEGVENISNVLAGDDLPDDIYLNFEDDEDCHPQKEALGCDDCRKDPDYVYCGKDLPAIGINNGDSYEDIFGAINDAIGECVDSTVLVKYENGDEIEFVTLSGGEHKEVIVPNCIPSEVQIYNSEGTLLQTITLEQGQSIGYTTPDSTAEIRYDDGTLITTVNIPSGETQTIYIPNCEPTITYITDDDGNPLGEVTLESGTNGTFVCPNGMVNVENSLGEVIGTGSVLSGGSGLVTVGDTNLVVEYVDGTPITTESIPSSTSDITITVPNCEDVEVTLENTAGLELDNETYASGTTNTMLAPDGTVVVKYEDGTPIETVSVLSGGSEEVIVPKVNVGGTAMPFVTGQTISYATGDDGDEQQGRDFFELDENNHFGNKWRFTGVTGGYYDRDTSQFKDIDGVVTTKILAFPNYIVCDHATKQKISGDDSILIHYMGGSLWLGIDNMDWSTAVAYNTTVNSIAPAGFNDKWFLVNERQARLLTHNGNLRYEPFSVGHGSGFIITSTSASDTPGSSFALNHYMRINLWIGGSEPISKSTAGNGAVYAFYTRITKLSEL